MVCGYIFYVGHAIILALRPVLEDGHERHHGRPLILADTGDHWERMFQRAPVSDLQRDTPEYHHCVDKAVDAAFQTLVECSACGEPRRDIVAAIGVEGSLAW